MNSFNEVKKALELLGLHKNAINFYLASYKIGLSSVGRVARTVKLDRSSAYLALNQLEEAGLIAEDRSSKVKKICARPPKAVLSRLRANSRRLRNQCIKIEDRLPELMAEYQQKDKQPVLQFFSGIDGLKQITDDILETNDCELLVFSNQKEEKRVFNSTDHKEFVRKRVKKNISIRVLVPDTPEGKSLASSDKTCLRETRVIREKNIPFTNEIYIYNDKIAMLEFVDEIQGFIVKSAAFHQAEKWMFEKLWKKYE